MAKRRQRRQETDADIDHATEMFCDALATRRTVRILGAEMTGRHASGRIRAKPREKQRDAGRKLLRQYRRDTNCVGAIDWAAFHEWLKEHMAELTLAKIIVSVISLLLFL